MTRDVTNTTTMMVAFLNCDSSAVDVIGRMNSIMFIISRSTEEFGEEKALLTTGYTKCTTPLGSYQCPSSIIRTAPKMSQKYFEAMVLPSAGRFSKLTGYFRRKYPREYYKAFFVKNFSVGDTSKSLVNLLRDRYEGAVLPRGCVNMFCDIFTTDLFGGFNAPTEVLTYIKHLWYPQQCSDAISKMCKAHTEIIRI